MIRLYPIIDWHSPKWQTTVLLASFIVWQSNVTHHLTSSLHVLFTKCSKSTAIINSVTKITSWLFFVISRFTHEIYCCGNLLLHIITAAIQFNWADRIIYNQRLRRWIYLASNSKSKDILRLTNREYHRHLMLFIPWCIISIMKEQPQFFVSVFGHLSTSILKNSTAFRCWFCWR